MKIKVGFSKDVHRLVENRKLILAGIEIPFEKGCLAHSDGDVLVHAVAEAILGALGLKDLGSHFSDKDPKYKDISSMLLLDEVNKLMLDRGFKIGNIDALIMLEKPKLLNYMDTIKKNLANRLNVDEDDVNVKATTYEKTGPVGNGELIEAYATVLLEKN